MSGPIDRYREGRDAGVRVPKPKADLQPLYRAIVERLSDRRPHGWTMAGLHLLGSADASEQRSVERSLNQLRTSVRKNHHDPEHVNSLVIRPPTERKTKVAFFLFPESKRASLKANMEQLAGQMLAEGKYVGDYLGK
jgi:hypothetical protein